MADNSRATILVVDDQAPVRQLINSALGASGYRVVMADSGWEALSICREHDGPIDIAILDVVMPGMSGVELRNCLLELIPRVPVLYMSGYPFSEIEKFGIQATENAFLAKPFQVGTLREKVRLLLASNQVRRAG